MGISKIFKKKNNIENTNNYKCKHCDMKFIDKIRLSRHIKKAHGENDDFMPNANPFQF